MNFIQNLSIRNKLLLISLIPLGALLYFLTQTISTQIASKNRIQQVYNDVLVTEEISNVIHNLQQERGYSIGYVSSSGAEEKTELFTQRDLTDKAINNLNKILVSQNKNKASINKIQDRIAMLRDRVNSFAITPDSIRYELATIIPPMVDEINKISFLSIDPEIKNRLINHMFLLYSKEYFGQVRATLKEVILSKGFKGTTFAEFASLKGKYEINLDQFQKNIDGEQAAFFERKMSSPVIRNTRIIIDSAYRDPAFNRFNFSINEWWVNGFSFLNILKEIEDQSSFNIRQTAQSRLDEISGSMLRSIVIAVAVIILIIGLLYYTIQSIVNSVRNIKDAADRMTRGDVDLTLHTTSKDEIGDLANSFNRMIQVSKEYAEAAEIIGKGDYTPVVNIRGDRDRLGISLNNMKNNLQQLSHENQMRTWLLTGTGQLNDKMRGDKEIRELAQEVINQLTTYLKAQIGTIYLSENGHLNLAGSYAFHHRKENSNVIKLGQGLVGQAALEKQPIIFTEIPDDYVKINSGLGNSSPKNIIIYPFFYEGQVKGVIEIGATHEFSTLDKQFLELVAENVGIAFNTTQSRAQLKELLEETQRQSEEMEAQQEELRQINEELQEKTQLLQNSEAELKAQQEELQQTNEELEEKANLLEEQKESLEVAKMEIENKARELEVNSKYKSEFLANMSHELRTPLNSILILAQLLAENKSNALGDKEVKYAQNIYSSGNDLLHLINEILDLSKVESGKMELDITQVNTKDLETGLRSLFGEVAKNRNIQFEINHAENSEVDQLVTDKQRLEQILRNLLSNAFKFTDKGGRVSLDLRMNTSRVLFRNPKLRQHSKVVAFSVTDTGIGIPEHKLGVIFEAFQQADGSTKRRYGGTGLGLSISRELANALGGEIHVHSSEGKGSTFTLFLPLKFDAALIEQTEKSIEIKRTPQPQPKQLRQAVVVPDDTPDVADDRYSLHEKDKVILIVEDDHDFVNILLDFAHERGYKAIVAHQGNTGLSLARYYRPDAIILDMILPVMDGSEVLKQLKNDPDLRHIPVQILSGFDRRKESLELGAFDFIKKPVKKEELQTAFEDIEEFLNKKLKKLLVVEDNRQQNSAIRELIGDGDVKSFSAYTGEEAFDLLQKENFDCIIIDLGLPDMSGFDLLEKIKINNELNKIPIIVYTGRDLSKEESNRLTKLASTVVLKTADSKERLLDETTLFLHRVESNLPKEKQQIIRKLHRTDEVLKNKKVLVVDDDMRNIYSLTNVLEEEGIKCITAENGNAAVKALEEHKDVDIILMDVMMPEMDGYEATRHIRKMNGFVKTPIIALTAKAMKGDREKCLEAGMSDYISKPVNIEQLLSLMRVWLYK